MASRGRRIMAGIGFLIVLSTGGALVWNEWQLARQLAGFRATAEALERLDTSRPQPNGGSKPAPLWTVGEAKAFAPIEDPFLDVGAKALRLDRHAETYQWREHREGSGDNKILRYERVWSPVLINSQTFERRSEHANPARLLVEPAQFTASDARLDDLRLSPEILARLPATAAVDAASLGLREAGGRRFVPHEGWLQTGDPAEPRVGDVRVRWSYAPEGKVSVIGAVDGDLLVSWRGPAGQIVALAAYGEIAAADMLGTAGREAWQGAWPTRGFGTLAMVIGFLFTAPALADRFGAERGKRRLLSVAMLGVGTAAIACAAGWIGSRLLLGLL